MPDVRDQLLSSYDYLLPQDRIAQAPVEPRHAARMLMVPALCQPSPSTRHGMVWDLLDELHPGDLLVVNDTRVLKARLKVRRSGGGLSELLVLDPRGEGRWLCLARPAKRMRPGDQLTIEGTEIQLKVLEGDADSGGRIVQFPADCKDAETIEGLLSQCGEVPLPPYINRHDPGDAARYQTRYADRPGAVAAPSRIAHRTPAPTPKRRELFPADAMASPYQSVPRTTVRGLDQAHPCSTDCALLHFSPAMPLSVNVRVSCR